MSLNQYFHATNVVYINGNLRRKLLGKVRKFKKHNHWHSAWTLDFVKAFRFLCFVSYLAIAVIFTHCNLRQGGNNDKIVEEGIKKIEEGK